MTYDINLPPACIPPDDTDDSEEQESREWAADLWERVREEKDDKHAKKSARFDGERIAVD